MSDLTNIHILYNEPMSRHTTFGIGGPADIFAEPRSIEDLRALLARAGEEKLPVTVIGGGSNILVRDEGIRGIAFRLAGPFFAKCDIDGNRATAGAGLSLNRFLSILASKGLSGMEPLNGIPGTVGGALVGNAGVYYSPDGAGWCQVADFLSEVYVMDAAGRELRLARPEIPFGYRSSGLGEYIILDAAFTLNGADRQQIDRCMESALAVKRERQEIYFPNAGCIFKNPAGSKLSAGALIDSCGLKGSTVGGAEVSARHANFIVNRGGASARDVMDLMDIVRERVMKERGIDLQPEVRIV